MTNDDERDLLAQALLALSLPELVDVLRRVLPAHSDPGGVMASKLILAEVAWQQGEVPTPPPAGHRSRRLARPHLLRRRPRSGTRTVRARPLF
jgi:hypothetical protein